MRDSATGFDICSPALDGLQHVEMVENIIERAVLWEAIKERPNRFFDLHGISATRTTIKIA
jgi:hypothetical protein